MIVLSHPTANANVRAIAMGMAENQVLADFYTSAAIFPTSFLDKAGGFPLLTNLRKRSFDPKLKPYTRQWPWRELGKTIASGLGMDILTRHEKGIFCIDKVYKSLDKNVSSHLKSKNIKAVYAYEDGALQSFTVAKEMGITCIYDLPIAYWETGRKLMQKEAERLPRWAVTLGGGIQDSAEKLERKTKELELADVVVGPGEFVMNSLPSWAKSKKLIVSPFGSPEIRNTRIFSNKNFEKPLRILFVGSMGQRKGLGDLFTAMKMLKNENVELVVLGSLLAPMEFYKSEYSNFIYEPCRPHNEVLKIMQTCDILCLPSLVEGRALVMQEAMSQGLPIIITPNTGGEDLINENETGFLIPIRSPDVIAEKIMWFVNNRNSVEEMGYYARRWAERYTWKKYSEGIVKEILAYLGEAENKIMYKMN